MSATATATQTQAPTRPAPSASLRAAWRLVFDYADLVDQRRAAALAARTAEAANETEPAKA